MKKYILFIAFVLASVVSFAQFSNYTNINGRYKWIAGKFDSTFTIPTGSTPSLRTGGANAPGAMFYRTTDSTIYQYTGTQWIKLRGGISPTDTAGLWITNLYRRNGTDSVFYVKGGSHTFAFRDSVGNAGGGGGGGKIYYFNGGVSMGTIGGLTMYELGDTANTGAAANFTRATTGNLANFITDPGKPGLLQIPAGVWTVDAYLSETGGGANHAQIWIEVEKWDGSTITTIATSPIEEITNGSVIDLYTWSVSIPTTSLAITDRIVIQFYISNTNGKTVTLYTQNGYVGEVHTTFTTGIGSLNGLTAPSQFFATGTSGTDFNISSSTATHTFNLPTASATNRGALSTTDWSTFNNKIGGSGTTNYVAKFTGTNAVGNSQIFDNGTSVGFNTTAPTALIHAVALGTPITAGAGTVAVFQRNQFNYNGASISIIGGNVGSSTLNFGDTDSETVGQIGYDHNVNGMIFQTNGSERMRLDASGNLGLGTTNPNTKMHVAGSLTVNDIIYLQRSSSSLYLPIANYWNGSGSPLAGTKGDILAIGNAGGDGLVFVNSNVERARIDASGNLGLGVTPSTWGGNTRAALEFANGVSLLGNIAVPAAYLNTNAYSSNGGSTWLYKNTDKATQYIQYDGQHLWYNAPSGTAGNAISFTQAMTLDASGNLGIGSTSPSNRLQITAAAGSSHARWTESATTIGFVGGANGIISGLNGSFAVRGESGLVLSGAGNAANVYINSSGNVGIGMTTPNAKLEVTSGVPVSAEVQRWSYNNGNADFSLRLRQDVSSGLVKHVFDVVNNATTYSNNLVLTNGSVGIGTSSPLARLHVYENGTGVYTLLRINNDNSTANFHIGVGGSAVANGSLQNNAFVWNVGNSATIFGTNDTERMRITSGGNVGIGSTSPTAKLEVNGSSLSTVFDNSTGVYSRWKYNGGNVGIIGTANQIIGGGSNTGFALGTESNDYVLFVTNNAERMRITSGGEVLIGTTTDAGLFKLQVDGNIYGSGLIQILGSIETGNPNGGTSKRWKLGSKVAASVSFDPDNYIEVDLNGTLYKLALAQ